MADTIFSVSICIVLIMLLRKVFTNHVPAKFIYALWLIPAIQLLLFGHSLYFNTGLYYEAFENIVRSPLQKIMPNAYDVLEYNLNQVLIQGESFVPELMEEKKRASIYTGITVWEILRIVWGVGAVITALCLAIPILRVWRYLRKYREKAPERLYGHKVFLVKNLSHSCLFFGKIYVDSEQGNYKEQLPFIVRHEAMHRRHGDDIWNLLRAVCVILYWFHPLVWLAAVVSKLDSEYACDEGTIQGLSNEEKILYGKTLLELTTMESYTRKREMLSCGIAGGRLKERIKRITAKEVKGKTIKKIVFLVIVILLVVLIGIFARYGVVRLATSKQYKMIQTYASYSVSEQIHANSVTYGNGQLYTIIKSDTNEVCEVKDKWLEVEEDGLFHVVIKNNLQLKEERVLHLGGKNTIEADTLAEPGTRWAEVSVSYDDKFRILVDSLTEEFSDNYPELKEGNYRMNYVLWYRDTDKYELLCVPFSVRNDK